VVTGLRTLRTRASLLLLLLAGVPGIALAGPYTRLQVLLPGETAASGTTTGKTGSPAAQTVGVPFSITVRACDASWATVSTVTNAVRTLSSDASATLPAPAQLVAGAATLSVTLNAAGTFTIYAHDQTDATIPDGASAPVQALAIQGFVFARITQKNQYAGTAMATTVTAVDPSGRTVTGYSGPVRLKEITSYGDGRVAPEVITLSAGQWSGSVTMYRADETSINRGNVNLYAWLENAPGKNGTSDPFTVHPGSFSRVQIVVPGESPLPGSVSGRTGTPASQGAGQNFAVNVWATDAWWNPVPSGDQVRVSSSDPRAASATGFLANGFVRLNVSLGTVGTQTLTVSDQSNGSIQGMTSPGIAVVPSAAHHFAIGTIASPVVAGAAVATTIRAVDANGNTVPDFGGDARLSANTGAGSISPELVTFTNGVWAGGVTFRGAGGAVSITCSDYSSPPHTGTSNSFVVQPGPFAGLQLLLPGETARGGTPDGKEGTPTAQSAGAPFTLTIRAVDAYWNLVSGIGDRVALGSSDAFAGIPAETTLANGQLLLSARLFRTGAQRIWGRDVTNPAARSDTSSFVTVNGGPFSKVLILAPGESPAPGTATGRTGNATDQSINYAFTVNVLATDSWWNPVGGVSDVVRLTCDDPGATLPADKAMVDGRAELSMRLARGGYNLITVRDVTNSARTGSSTQVRAISSGFHLEAAISPVAARAGEAFTLIVRVTNDAGSVIQEINSFVTLEVQNASTRAGGRGTLLSTQFQLLQGQRAVSETYTFAEPIVVVAHDDAGNAPATSNAITIVPGPPAAIRLASAPAWVGGNKHAIVSARLVDDFENGVPAEPVSFALLSGAGTLTPVDSLTDSTGVARADFLSPRQPERDRIRAGAGAVVAEFELETAFVDPNASGGTATNYPNPFHPPTESTVIAYKLDDDAAVRLRLFTQSGDLVRSETFERGTTGGKSGLNEWPWDGRNGGGQVVSSGGYLLLIEAQGQGATLHVIRRKIAVVR
jgi:hypothetical protein